MADLLITMTDGSQYLAHHGVQGMHWGEWNEETRRKYLGPTSSKGDKLRKKAGKKRLQAEQARTEKAVLTRASQVHANDISKSYASANAHRIKQQAYERRAGAVNREKESLKYRHEYESKGADIPMDKKTEKKIAKLDRKAEKLSQKAKVQEDAAKRESDKGHAASNKIERHNIAVREMDAKAAKLNAKAAKLEKKADRADAKQDAKVAKAAAQVRNNAKNFSEEGKVIAARNQRDEAEMNLLDAMDKHNSYNKSYKESPKEVQRAWDVVDKAQQHLDSVTARVQETSKASTMDRMNLAASAQKYVATSGTDSAKLGMLGSIKVKDRAKFEAEVNRVMEHSITEAALISKMGQEAVDMAIERAMGSKRMYRY